MNKNQKNNPIWNIYCHRYTASNGISFCWFGSRARFFLPMHIPVLLSGFVLGSAYGLGVGVITPLLSSILLVCLLWYTPVPMVRHNDLELGAYGMVSGLLNKKFKLNMIRSLLGSMLAGRIAAGIVVAVTLYVFGFKKFRKSCNICRGRNNNRVTGYRYSTHCCARFFDVT